MEDVKDNQGITDKTDEEKAQEEQDKNDELASVMSTKAVMSTQTGRHFVWELLKECCVYQDTFASDPYVHARNAGDKGAGLRLLSKILIACPGEYERMFAEHKYKEEKND